MYMQTTAHPFPYQQQPYYNHQEFQQNGPPPPKPPPPPSTNPVKNKPKKEQSAADVNKVVDGVISQLKMKGIFDQFRRESITHAEDKPYYRNLNTKVTSTVDSFLKGQTWKPNFPKINVRNSMRKKIEDSSFFKKEIGHIITTVLDSNMSTSFKPIIEKEVYDFLGCQEEKAEEKDDTMDIDDDETMEDVEEPEAEDKVENETFEKENEIFDKENEAFEEDESDDESPMFEKIGDVSPPRPVMLENSEDILRELQEEALRNSKIADARSPEKNKSEIASIAVEKQVEKNVSVAEEKSSSDANEKSGSDANEKSGSDANEKSGSDAKDKNSSAVENSDAVSTASSSTPSTDDTDEDCKYLQVNPLLEKKLAYYKKLNV